MDKRKEANVRVKRSITEALLGLMQKKASLTFLLPKLFGQLRLQGYPFTEITARKKMY